MEFKSHLSKTVIDKGMNKGKKDPLNRLSFEHFISVKKDAQVYGKRGTHVSCRPWAEPSLSDVCHGYAKGESEHLDDLSFLSLSINHVSGQVQLLQKELETMFTGNKKRWFQIAL